MHLWSPTANGRRQRNGRIQSLAYMKMTTLVCQYSFRFVTSECCSRLSRFCGARAAIMADDLATTPNIGVRVQTCGDAHLGNFGIFATPERNLHFDITDFDETLPAPWEWDVKRLAVSVQVAADGLGMDVTQSGIPSPERCGRIENACEIWQNLDLSKCGTTVSRCSGYWR